MNNKNTQKNYFDCTLYVANIKRFWGLIYSRKEEVFPSKFTRELSEKFSNLILEKQRIKKQEDERQQINRIKGIVNNV